MKRAFAVLTVSWLLLVCFVLNFSARSGLTIQASATTKAEAAEFRAQGPSLTIVFRGLMVFHPGPAREYFELGILPAPEHEFRVQVIENSPEGVSSFFVPLGELKHDLWSLEFANSNQQGVSFYQSEPFDRKAGLGDKRDFRWVLNLKGSEFYDRELQTDPDQLGVALHVRGGEFYTNKRTPSLMRKKGDGSFEYFGQAAQEVATDVSLEDGDMVLKSEKLGTEILRLKQNSDTTYEVIVENVPIPQAHMMLSGNHFQYYYRLLAIPKAEWYEFKPAKRAISSQSTDSLRTNLVRANYVISDEAPCMPAGW